MYLVDCRINHLHSRCAFSGAGGLESTVWSVVVGLHSEEVWKGWVGPLIALWVAASTTFLGGISNLRETLTKVVQASSRVHSSNFHAFQSTTYTNFGVII